MDDMRARAETIEDFAALLRELRDSVGNPPFREMSGRSGAISHTTLHEATKGNRLPSWETTVEFVKACGADPAGYRERWERANRAVRAPNAAEAPVAAGSSVPAPSPPPDAVFAQPVPPARASRGRPVVLAALAVAALAVGTVVFLVAERGSEPDDPGENPVKSPEIVAQPAIACPVAPVDSAPAPATHEGDAATFIDDVTLRDCTRLGFGEKQTKIWRIKNTGRVTWKGYWLRRLDAPEQTANCHTASRVPIEQTRPGRTVDIRVDVTTPSRPGLCYARFKMMDAAGKLTFPGSRPIYFQLVVGE